MDHEPLRDTESEPYAHRLVQREQTWWKSLLPVQAPYRWNLRRQALGRTLDVGCGIGRNLETLDPGSVGVDHNVTSIEVARSRGHVAMTQEEFEASNLSKFGAFDSLLLAHVVEHMDGAGAEALLRTYLPYLRSTGKVFMICPQESGYASDSTHVRFTTGDDLVELAGKVGLIAEKWFSFPLPRVAGKVFLYNEFCLLARKRS